jgi:HNH endonuclease
MKLTLEEKFMARVRQDPASGCWLWTAHITGDGYGCAYFAGQRRGAHRLAWQLFRGKIPVRKIVCHRCDVRACVNPAHLFLGTPAENAADMKRKGRSTSGEKSPNCKLNAATVLKIKALLAEDRWYMTEIARQFGISHQTVSDIKKGKRWQHVQLPESPSVVPEGTGSTADDTNSP